SREKVPSVEITVADELPQSAVHLVCTSLGDHVKDAAGVMAVLRAKATGQHFDFLQGVGRRIVQSRVTEHSLVVLSVEQEQVKVSLRAGHGHGSAAAIACKRLRRADVGYAGQQRRQ